MASSLATWAGVALALGGALALPGLIGGASGREDLTVEIPGARFHTTQANSAAALPKVRLDPSNASLTLGSSGPGLSFMRWNKDYGTAYRREVTWPVLTGPFTEEAAYVCGYQLHLGAGMFAVPSQGALSRELTEMINESMPEKYKVPELSRPIRIPRAWDVVASVRLVNAFAFLNVRIEFIDDTVLTINKVPLRLVASRGQLVLERVGELRAEQVSIDGPFKEQILRQAVSDHWFWSLLFEDDVRAGASAKISHEANQIVSDRLKTLVNMANIALARLNEPFHPIATRSGDDLSLRLERDPTVTPRGITLPICARIRTSSPRMDDALRGFVAPAQPEPAAAPQLRSDSSIALSLGPSALSQVAYYLWQSRTLDGLGRSTEVLSAASEHLRQVDFDFEGFSLGLPPTLTTGQRDAQSIQVALGNVRLGTAQASDVMAHGMAKLRVASNGDGVELQASLAAVHLNCVERQAGSIKLTPCLADLLPIARERLSAAPLDLSWRGADLLAKLPSLELGDTRLTMSGLRASTIGAPATLELSATARFE